MSGEHWLLSFLRERLGPALDYGPPAPAARHLDEPPHLFECRACEACWWCPADCGDGSHWCPECSHDCASQGCEVSVSWE